jgi:nucleoside-diphosphate-sugar epimerase
MRVLITGGAGYIGSTLARELLDLRHFKVRVLDSLRGGGDSLLGMMGNDNFEFIKGDIRDSSIINKSLKGVDAVIHLAALVGHPLCNAFPNEAESVNYGATTDLFNAVIRDRVPRFIFSSTCSNYGVQEGVATEDSPLNPTNVYARTKVQSEEYIIEKEAGDTCATVLRFATAFGISPKTRMDLLLHEFVRDAIHKKEILVYHPEAWRPYIHVRDAAQAIIKCIITPTKKINGEIINVGADHNNITKIDLANLVAKHIPDTHIRVVETGEDRRDYKVSFNKQRLRLSYVPTRSLEDGIIEMRDAIINGLINPFDRRFYNWFPREFEK